MASTTRSLAIVSLDSLVKVMRKKKTHHGFTYQLGLNVCPQPFNEKECGDGGLYACRLRDLFKWISLYEDIDTVALVEIPANAQVVWFETKVKASALTILRFIPLLTAVHLSIEKGGDVRANNNAAVRWASANGRLDVVKYLVEHGADVHVNNNVAVLEASMNGHLDVVKYIKSLPK